jgi:hypothetical protein
VFASCTTCTMLSLSCCNVSCSFDCWLPHKLSRVLQRLLHLCIALLEAESYLEQLINLVAYSVDLFDTLSIFDSRSVISLCALPSITEMRRTDGVHTSGLIRIVCSRNWRSKRY